MSKDSFLFCNDCGSVLVSNRCPHCASKVSDLADDIIADSPDVDLSHLPPNQQKTILNITRWYRKVIRPAITGEADQYSINLNTQQGQFELFCLALLLSAERERKSTDIAFKKLRARGIIDFNRISKSEDHQDLTEKITESLNHLPEGQAESFAKRIVISALKISRDLDGQLSELWNVYQQNADRIINLLAETEARGGSFGLGDKSLWFAREMKMANVWQIAGEYCCASENVALKRLLERIGFDVPLERRPVPRMIRVSKIIWSLFRENYDIPSVAFTKNICKEEPLCSECPIANNCDYGKEKLQGNSE